MAQVDIDEILNRTLDDRRLSRGEKRALGSILEERAPDATELALYRYRAFEIARQRLKRPEDRELLEWLEDVVKALSPKAAPAPRTEPGRAFFSPRDDCPREICRLIRRARRKLDVCVFTVTDNSIADALLDAHRRGVALRVITDDEKAFDLGSDSERLQRAGVPVRYDRSEHHMHHKFALFDQATLLTGSYNWTRSAARDNQENIVVTEDGALVKAFQEEFERLWHEFGGS